MNILLVNMPIRLQAQPNVIPTGLGILAAQLTETGHDCQVLDLNIHRPPLTLTELRARLQEYQQDFGLIGLSGMITTLRWQQQLARLIREIFPQTYLVSGGGLASDFGQRLFTWLPELNGVAIGEGEPLLPAIIQAAREGQPKQQIFGPSLVADLNHLPQVAWHHFAMETYLAHPVWGQGAGNSSWTPFRARRSINLITSRGCPYNCHFCDRITTGGRHYRLTSAQRLLADVNEVSKRFQVDFIGFVDDNFLANQARLTEFLPAMARQQIRWGCHGRLNEIDNELAVRLKDAGCVYIGFGGESADETVLRNMNKKNNPAQMAAGVQVCQRHGITPNCTWIMGYPGEDRAALRRTCRFIIDHGLSQKNMFVATAYPGTTFFEQVKDKILAVYPSLYDYVLDLDDASKTLGRDGKILNYSAMDDAEFLECRQLVAAGELAKI